MSSAGTSTGPRWLRSNSFCGRRSGTRSVQSSWPLPIVSLRNPSALNRGVIHETIVNRRDGLVLVMCRPGIRSGRRSAGSAHGCALARRHLSAWYRHQWISRHDRNPDGRHRNQLSRSQSGADRKCNGHNCSATRRCDSDQRRGMFDRGDVGVGNVRIDRQLRRRRNGTRNRGACHCGNDGQHGDVGCHWDASHRGDNGPHDDAGNINIVGNVNNVGNVDKLRNAGHVGNVGNVRLRLNQHCFILDSYVDVAHNAGRRRSHRNSVGFDGNRQSRGQLRTGGTDDRRIAHCGNRGTEFVAANGAHCFTCNLKHCDVYGHWRHRQRWDRERRNRWGRERRGHRNVGLGTSAQAIHPLSTAMKMNVIDPAGLPTAVPAPARRAILVRLSERSSMRPFLIVAATLPLLCCGPAFAQVGTVMPPLGVTSSLGTDPSAPVGTNGFAPGVSTPVNPVPNGVPGTIAVPSTSSGAGACSTLATSPMGTFGSPATYDGGGMAMATGTTTPATVAPSGTSMSSGISTSSAISATSGVSTSSGMLETSGLSGMCGSGSSSMASSSSPNSTSSTTSGAPPRNGAPLGSYQIGNLGVSPPTALRTTSVSPITGSVGSAAPSMPTMPTVSPPATASSTTTSTIP